MLYLDVTTNTAWSLSGVMASWLVYLSVDRVAMVWVQILAGVTVLYSWARHLTLTVLLFIQVYMYKWIPANLMLGAKHTTNKHPIQGE